MALVDLTPYRLIASARPTAGDHLWRPKRCPTCGREGHTLRRGTDFVWNPACGCAPKGTA